MLSVDFFVNNAITIFCLYVPREHTPETWQAPSFNNHILRIGINNHEQSSRTVNNHVWEHFCLSLLHFLGAAPRSCRGVSPLFSILLSTLLHRSPLFSILLFISPIFHFYSLQCSISVLHFPYYSFSLFPISLSKLLDLSPLFSILLSQYVPSCFAILLYITISQFPSYSLRYSILLSI